ncbi:adenylate/guanylate cyclase domain-containing protein [Nisaea denitrificans]|uniref:adenylate/guanylate cyclase domain-containing protein n=1 Tax=Nisaea denitrificans TaxID=390877 RepID=UPI000405CCB0|nr:adenylate/guanylate cyclase domain-containing protein [Nisaea denitrificans]
MLSREFVRHLEAPRARVWEALADTARYNESVGLPKHDIREEPQPDGSVRFYATARIGFLTLNWEDIPQEWSTGNWFRHRRLFLKGPLKQLNVHVRFEDVPNGEGCMVHYRTDIEPRNLIGRILAHNVIFPVNERNFILIANRIEEWAKEQIETPYPTEPMELDEAHSKRLESVLTRLDVSHYGHGLGRKLADWLLSAQEVDLMHIRPLRLARQWEQDERHVIELCLQAVKDGLLESRWDLLCPRCKGAKISESSLEALPQGAHCPSCNVSYDRDFARNVELTFQPAASIRKVVHGEFCLFGPMSTPHVRLQVRIAPGESESVETELAPGSYRIRTLEPGPERILDFSGGGFPSVAVEEEDIASETDGAADAAIMLKNRCQRPRVVIVEARDWAEDALTAHRVTTMQAFRHLFAEDVLRGGDEVGIAHITLMFTDLSGSTALYEKIGDAPAYGLVREHFDFLSRIVREHDGGVVKTIGDAVMASFAEPENGLRATLDIRSHVLEFNQQHPATPIGLKLGLHTGPCIAVTLNGRLDYFGSTVNMAARLQGEAGAGEIVISEAIASDPAAAEVLKTHWLEQDRRAIRGFKDPVTFRRLPPEDTAHKPT